jgi:predicted RNA-binding Zn-ribbon protein involved in translation (DUF1610 family)
MPIQMTCPSCGKLLSAPEAAVGKRAKCPECAQIMIVPDAVFEAELVGDHSFHSASPFADLSPYAAPREGLSGDSAGLDSSSADATAEPRRPCPECGERIMTTAAKCRFCGAIFDPRLRGRGYRALCINVGPPGEYARQLRICFNLWWACLPIGTLIAVAGIALAAAKESPEFAALVIVGLVLMAVGAVSHLVLVYKLWKVVQDGRAQTTPGCAVGFMFIPCFNIYWQFVAVWGLAKELNRISRDYHIGAPEASESHALAGCVLYCCRLVPYLNALAMLAEFVISIVLFKNLCDVAVVIAGTRTIPTN